MMLIVAVVGCEKEPTIDPSAKQKCIVSIGGGGVTLEGSTSGVAIDGSTLLAAQVYEMVDGEYRPYAYGMYDNWRLMNFKAYTQTEYRVVTTLVMKGKDLIAQSDEIWSKPFGAKVFNTMIYGTETLDGLGFSTADLKQGGIVATPTLDRYYAETTKTITAEDPSLKIAMKRVTFGMTVDGCEQGDEITVKVAGAPEVTLAEGSIEYFTLNDLPAAFNADESQSPYEESIITKLYRNGAEIFNGAVAYRRNALTKVTITKEGASFGFEFEEGFESGLITPPEENSSPYITKVFEYRPAPGQFVNVLPKWDEGDTQEDMNKKVLDCIGLGNNTIVTLGAYGGYVTVGFDHTIENVEGKRDFRVRGNSFYSAANPSGVDYKGGSCEPGVIQVAFDANHNGEPDDEWYEIAGSSHRDVTSEPWYDRAKEKGNDVNFYYRDFELTYTAPTGEPTKPAEYKTYIPWTDNKGNTGYVSKNGFHRQQYYPGWITDKAMTFTGTRLPQNAIDESGKGSYFVLYMFSYGYADNELNKKDDSTIDIEWAIDEEGNRVSLPGVDFIRVYNGVNQYNGALGESSTEIEGIEDLHMLGIDIDTRN